MAMAAEEPAPVHELMLADTGWPVCMLALALIGYDYN